MKRPNLVEAYDNGAQIIDVHNYLRQGPLRLKAPRPRAGRCASSFNCLLGISTVDAYLAYKRFGPNKDTSTKMTSCST